MRSVISLNMKGFDMNTKLAFAIATDCPFEGAFLKQAAQIVQLEHLSPEDRVMMICNLRAIARSATDAWEAEAAAWQK